MDIREWTDNELNKMEKHISGIYKKASKGIYKNWNEFMKKADEKTSKLQSVYDDAKKSGDKDEIKNAGIKLSQYKKEVTLYDDQYKEMIKETAEQLSNVNKTALAYANNQMPSIYMNNFNDIKIDADELGINFGIVNEATVKRLIADGDLSLLQKRLDIPKDMRWNTKQLNSAVLQGILQGESMNEIAKRIVHITNNNENSAIRNARTMTTCAENKGLLDSAKELEKQGAVMGKIWSAVGDSRTRDLHLYLDGQEVELDEPFVDDNGNELDHPGDPTAAAETVFNCRCRMKRHIIGFRKKDGRIEYINYEREETLHDRQIKEEKEKRESVRTEKINKNNLNVIDQKEQMYDDWYSEDARRQRLFDIQQYSGFNEEKSKLVANALCGDDRNGESCYFNEFDTEIRKGETKAAKEMADIIQQYIDASPKYKGKIYRGMSVSDEQLKNLTIGSKFNEQQYSISSWSSREDVSQRYANTSQRENGGNRVVFEYENPKHGTPVKHLSMYETENEVLVNNKNINYEIINIEEYMKKDRKYTKIILKEINE